LIRLVVGKTAKRPDEPPSLLFRVREIGLKIVIVHNKQFPTVPTVKDSGLEGDRWQPIKRENEPKPLEIGTLGLKLNSDSKEYKTRGEFWEKVYKEHPLTYNNAKSKTLKNSKMYKKIKGDGETKREEL
jgi:hypothetical protein